MARKRGTRKSYRRRGTKSPVNQMWRMLPWPLRRLLFASPGGWVAFKVFSSLGQ